MPVTYGRRRWYNRIEAGEVATCLFQVVLTETFQLQIVHLIETPDALAG